MSLLLKIVKGPNSGAEIALVEGVTITIGKTDDCDVILADQTLPEESVKVAVGSGGVAIDGVQVDEFEVIERGATAFAVGPADSSWGKLKWPEAVAETKQIAPLQSAKDEDAESANESREAKPKKRAGCLVRLLVWLLILIAIAAICWFFRARLRPYAEKARPYADKTFAYAKHSWFAIREKFPKKNDSTEEEILEANQEPVSAIERYNLEKTTKNGREVYVGDFALRADRLAATAEVYAEQPGADIDFADEESLRTAVAETLSLVGENELSVSGVTGRSVVLTGKARNLDAALEAISADVPKIASVNTQNVKVAEKRGKMGSRAFGGEGEEEGDVSTGGEVAKKKPSRAQKPNVSLPVCGILVKPYPCLVLSSGARIMEGAAIGEAVVEKIEADCVTLSKGGETFIWKP